jgi:hypothetical protein
MKWMSRQWSAPSVAEVVLKLFYKQGISSPKFVQALYFLVQDWPTDRQIDVISVLIIGEKEECIAQFISGWMNCGSLDRAGLVKLIEGTCILISGLAKCLRWSSEFSKMFLFELVDSVVADSVVQRTLSMMVLEEMESKEAIEDKPRSIGELSDASDDRLSTFLLLFELIVHEKQMSTMISLG